MAKKKISELSALTVPATGDLLPIVDISDTSQAASGSTKKITFANLMATPPAIGGTTPNAGSFTTVDATGNVTISNSSPGYYFTETDATADNGKTILSGSSARFRLYFSTDAGTLGTAPIEITRSGETPASHTYTGTSFAFNGGNVTVANGDIIASAGRLSGRINVGAEQAVTVASGVITLTAGKSNYVVSGEGGAADTVDTISTTGVSDGDIIYLRDASNSQDITYSTGTGNLVISANKTILTSAGTISFIYRSSLSGWRLLSFEAG